LIGLVASGCLASASGDQLTRRASFDLGCSANNLRYHRIDEQTQGVSGCGKRATYVVSCDGPRTNVATTCTWLINGAIITDPVTVPSTIAPSIDDDAKGSGAGDGSGAPNQGS
jgi:hypothetical protein